MGLTALRRVVWAVAALAVAVGASFPVLVGQRLGLDVPLAAVGQGAMMSLAPGLAIVLVGRLARQSRSAALTALVGASMVLTLGIALYVVALSSPSVRAPYVAVRLVPLRQLAACAVAAWAVWLVRRSS